MREVVVIGGGLTGLSACYELEKLGLRYTIIELKRRFGGAIRSTRESGFIMDASAFASSPLTAEPWLPELGLADQILPLSAEASCFRAGTESLIRALAAQLSGGRLMRMAVSSLGHYKRRHTICLENGLMLDAGALILAVPARYAVRMLYNLAPAAAECLAEHRCETTWHIALGLHKRNLPATLPADDFAFIHTCDHPARVPDCDHVLVQLGLAAPPDASSPDVIQLAADRLGLAPSPIAASATPADCALSAHNDDHSANLRLIRALLPAGISLVGSDFLPAPPAPGLAQLAERMGAGREAAQAAARFLKARKPR